MNLGVATAVAMGAIAMLGMFYGKRRDKMKELIKELEAAHKRINNPDDMLRLSNEIGIAILKLAQEEKEERRDRHRLSDLRADDNTKAWDRHVRHVEARLDAADAKYDEVLARCERTDAETHRLLRKIAGEPEPASEPMAASADTWDLARAVTSDFVCQHNLVWRYTKKDRWWVFGGTNDNPMTGWIEDGVARGPLLAATSPIPPIERTALYEMIESRNLIEPEGPCNIEAPEYAGPSEGENHG